MSKTKRPDLIERRVALAQRGANPFVIGRMPSGWLVIGDVQPLPGYCLLLADPVATSLNALTGAERARFLGDMARAGDALLQVTGAHRINYEVLGNQEPSLHAHLTPRYASELPFRRRLPPRLAYARLFARRTDPDGRDAAFLQGVREALAGGLADADDRSST